MDNRRGAISDIPGYTRILEVDQLKKHCPRHVSGIHSDHSVRVFAVSQGLDTGSSPVGVTKEIRVGPRVDVFARGLIGIKKFPPKS
jgi:hypothetical protein